MPPSELPRRMRRFENLPGVYYPAEKPSRLATIPAGHITTAQLAAETGLSERYVRIKCKKIMVPGYTCTLRPVNFYPAGAARKILAPIIETKETPPPPGWLSSKEAAAALGISTSALSRRAGALSRHKARDKSSKTGRPAYFYSPQEIKALGHTLNEERKAAAHRLLSLIPAQ